MKKISILLTVLFAAVLVQAQSTYKYVIVPINVPGIGKGIDPYGVSSSLQKILNGKSIKSVYETPERPADYCDALIAYMNKENSMLKNKLSIELRDCMNRVIWSNVGTGMSKEYREGYAEAIEDALKDFNALPAVQYATAPAVAAPVAPAAPAVAAPAAPVVEKPAEVGTASVIAIAMGPDANGKEQAYEPKNIYFNEKYLVDYVKDGNDGSFIVLNSDKLGYEKLQVIAKLQATDIPGIYTVEWTKPDRTLWKGVAKETNDELKISISSGGSKEVIDLQKQ